MAVPGRESNSNELMDSTPLRDCDGMDGKSPLSW